VVGDEQDEPAIDGWTLVGLGGMLVGCVVIGLVLGWLVDDLAGSAPVGILAGLAIGVVVGVVGSCLRVVKTLRP
jgi:F0F1-type ATP synthase assembly protein I